MGGFFCGRSSCTMAVVPMQPGGKAEPSEEGISGCGGRTGQARKKIMKRTMEKVTPETLAERYAAMSDEQFAALDAARLTPEAAAVHAAEAEKRGVGASGPEMQARRCREMAEAVRKKRRRQFAASVLLLAAVLAERFSDRLPAELMDAKSVVVIALAVLAVAVLKKR